MEFEKIKEIITEVLSAEPEDITMEASFSETFGADSLQMFQLIIRLQEVFAIRFEESVIEKLETVENVISYIQKMES